MTEQIIHKIMLHPLSFPAKPGLIVVYRHNRGYFIATRPAAIQGKFVGVANTSAKPGDSLEAVIYGPVGNIRYYDPNEASQC